MFSTEQQEKEHPMAEPALQRRIAPYGWRWIPNGAGGQVLYPEVSEQRAIRQIRKLRAFGSTLREIVDQLDEDAFPPPRGPRWQAADLLEILDRDEDPLWEEWQRWSGE
jgi:hypothetical protein